MSKYEANPGGLGVGKRYGPLHLGGVGGVTAGDNGEFRLVAEITAKELQASSAISFKAPDGYGRITACYVEVETAFGVGDTVDVLYDGVTILSAPIAVTTLGVTAGTLAVTAFAKDKAFTIDTALIDSGDLDGSIKVVVVLERV